MNRTEVCFPWTDSPAQEIIEYSTRCWWKNSYFKTYSLMYVPNRMKEKRNSDNIKEMANFNGPVFSDKQSKTVSEEHMAASQTGFLCFICSFRCGDDFWCCPFLPATRRVDVWNMSDMSLHLPYPYFFLQPATYTTCLVVITISHRAETCSEWT